MPPAQANQIKFQRNLRKWLLFGSLLILAFVLAQWFFNRASIEVVVENASGGEITYQFKNQANEKIVEVKDTAKRIKKNLTKGNYEITVLQGGSNYFAVIKTDDTDTVKARLETEKGRRFIGNQPEQCLFMRENILLSYICGDAVTTLKTHAPATDSLPTLKKPTLTKGENIVEGLVHTSSGQDVLLVRESVEAGHAEFSEGHSPHTGFEILGNPAVKTELSDRVAMEDLEGQYSYNLVAYKNGFIAHNDEFTHALYYENLKAKPQKFRIEDLSDERLKARAIRIFGESYVVRYAEGENNTTAIVYSGNESKRYDFDKALSSVLLCGESLLCGTAENTLEVYSVKNEKPELLYHMPNVTAIENLDENHLLVAKREGVLKLDVNARSGTLQYRLGSYRFCGFALTEDSYVVCVLNSEGGRSVLAIQQDQISDTIDQKVASLEKLKEINTVSAYGDFIFISPETGKVRFDPAQQGYVYDQEVIKSSNVKINQKIEDLRIDRNKYRIMNSFDD